MGRVSIPTAAKEWAGLWAETPGGFDARAAVEDSPDIHGRRSEQQRTRSGPVGAGHRRRRCCPATRDFERTSRWTDRRGNPYCATLEFQTRDQGRKAGAMPDQFGYRIQGRVTVAGASQGLVLRITADSR